MSRDLSKLSLYAIVNFTANAATNTTVGGVTIPVAGITVNNSGNFIVLWKLLTADGVGAGTPDIVKPVATGIQFHTSVDTDLSTYQFTIYQQE